MAAKPSNAGGIRDYPRILVPPPGPRSREVVERDRQWSSTSYIKASPLVVSHGRGAMLEDLDGNRSLDFMAGIAVASTGYAHPQVVAAITEAAGRVQHLCGTDFYAESMSVLMERPAQPGPGPSKKGVFLTNSGTEAVEGAIKLVRSSTRRSDLIAFQGAFHGRSYGSMSLTSSKAKQRAHFGPFLPGVHHVPYPNPYRLETGGRDAGTFVLDLLRNDLFKRHLSPDDVAAVFVEPMQGEGGYVIPPPGFLAGLRDFCAQHGTLLVSDEIQTGAGRTGKMWAAAHVGVAPAVLLSAKGLGSGLPIGAIIAKESVMKWEAGSHGSTFGGNPVCCAAALATLDLLEGGLMENARRMGERLLAGLQGLRARHQIIGDVRRLGLFVGIELVEDRKTKAPAKALALELEQRAFQKGLLLLQCGESVIRMAPPLVIDEVDVDTALRIFDECLSEQTR